MMDHAAPSGSALEKVCHGRIGARHSILLSIRPDHCFSLRESWRCRWSHPDGIQSTQMVPAQRGGFGFMKAAVQVTAGCVSRLTAPVQWSSFSSA